MIRSCQGWKLYQCNQIFSLSIKLWLYDILYMYESKGLAIDLAFVSNSSHYACIKNNGLKCFFFLFECLILLDATSSDKHTSKWTLKHLQEQMAVSDSLLRPTFCSVFQRYFPIKGNIQIWYDFDTVEPWYCTIHFQYSKNENCLNMCHRFKHSIE